MSDARTSPSPNTLQALLMGVTEGENLTQAEQLLAVSDELALILNGRDRHHALQVAAHPVLAGTQRLFPLLVRGGEDRLRCGHAFTYLIGPNGNAGAG